jgi:hypothetical protein
MGVTVVSLPAIITKAKNASFRSRLQNSKTCSLFVPSLLIMALQTYFESLRGTHAEPVKIVLVRDNAAGSVSTDQFVRRRRSFFLLDFLDSSRLSPLAPQRAESWRSSSTDSSAGSGDSARSILEYNDIGGRMTTMGRNSATIPLAVLQLLVLPSTTHGGEDP